jgi:CRISPR system Cascade subunit CasC
MHLPRFLQIHTLHNFPAALLNRDDAGLAKRLPYGDAVRTRVSSQCLKRHWRVADDAFALSRLDVPMAVRSRGTLALIRDRLVRQGVDDGLAQVAAEGLRSGGLLDKSKDLKGKDALETGQAVLLGHAEIDYLVQRCADLARQHADEKALKGAITTFLKDEKKNIEALRHGSGLESALFGRMVTSDVLASRDAAVYVAHAFTVHEAQVENDYFTVVDDLPQLVANLEGADRREWHTVPIEQRELAGRVVQHLLHLVATVSPGAKRGSTAPFEWAKFMLVEAGDWQPRSLAGAFLNALDLRQPALRQAAVRRLADELKQLDDAYGAPLARRYLAVDDGIDVPGARRLPLHALAEWAKVAVTQAQAQAEG